VGTPNLTPKDTPGLIRQNLHATKLCGKTALLASAPFTARRVRYGVGACQSDQLETFPYHQLASKASLIIATMASKFMASKLMANAAFEARLLLRPSHQRTVWTVNKLECPIPGRPKLPPILSSRSYSESTPTPPLPKTSGSTKSSQSPGPEDKNWSPPKVWLKGGAAWALAWALTGAVALAGALLTVGTVRAGSFLCHLKHANYQRVLPNMSARKRGKIGTKHLRDVNTNLHENLQSTISSKRDLYFRRRLNTLSYAYPLSRK
jgi:hypothetical protein